MLNTQNVFKPAFHQPDNLDINAHISTESPASERIFAYVFAWAARRV
jgi:hypothetical protein